VQVSSEGHVMGSLGIMDLVPRTFPPGGHGNQQVVGVQQGVWWQGVQQ